MKRWIAVVLGVAPLLLVGAYLENRANHVIDASQSKLEIHVYREGFLKAFGHDHLVSPEYLSGRVQFAQSSVEASSVSFTVETKSLVVLDPGESEKDKKEVQATMLGEKVLDAARYPQIRFVSSSVRSTGKKEGVTQLQVEGKLTLHGVEKRVTLPVRLREDAGTLIADGEVFLLQSDFGMTPIKVGGGAVRVKDKLKVAFHVVAPQGAIPEAGPAGRFTVEGSAFPFR